MATRFLTRLTAAVVAALAIAGCSRLGAFNAVIPKDPGVALVAHDIAYGTDPRQKLDIYAPAVSEKPAGMIVFVYGGSWNSGTKSDYAFAARALAARGYVTVVFDYRLVPTIRYPAFVEDTARALAWSWRNAGRYGADPKRVYLMGHSAGAYNAMMVALAPEFLRAEGLSPSIIQAAAALSGPYDFLPLAVDETRQAFAGAKDLRATQPVHRVRAGTDVPPILLATGDADEFVYPRNTVALAAALRRAGHTVEEKHYAGIDHVGTLLALSRPLRGKAPVLDDVIDFFRRH